MVKETMNKWWRIYVSKQIKRGVNKEKIGNILRKEGYSHDIINEVLYLNEIENDLKKTNINNDFSSNKIIHNKNPIVETYPNFLSDEECELFINISKNNLKQALVIGDKGNVVSNVRTGESTWIKHDFNKITKNIAERIAKLVGIPLKNAEAFQVIHYDKKQEYKNHYDSWDHDNSDKTLRSMKYGGARLMTALCYLNNVEKGGGTRLPKLNITIPPEKGKLLVFQNTISKDNHNKHPLSLHAGMPVEIGEKYAFNLWFRECPRNILYKDFNPDYYK